jgi:hypothetical protein
MGEHVVVVGLMPSPSSARRGGRRGRRGERCPVRPPRTATPRPGASPRRGCCPQHSRRTLLAAYAGEHQVRKTSRARASLNACATRGRSRGSRILHRCRGTFGRSTRLPAVSTRPSAIAVLKTSWRTFRCRPIVFGETPLAGRPPRVCGPPCERTPRAVFREHCLIASPSSSKDSVRGRARCGVARPLPYQAASHPHPRLVRPPLAGPLFCKPL